MLWPVLGEGRTSCRCQKRDDVTNGGFFLCVLLQIASSVTWEFVGRSEIGKKKQMEEGKIKWKKKRRGERIKVEENERGRGKGEG